MQNQVKYRYTTSRFNEVQFQKAAIQANRHLFYAIRRKIQLLSSTKPVKTCTSDLKSYL